MTCDFNADSGQEKGENVKGITQEWIHFKLITLQCIEKLLCDKTLYAFSHLISTVRPLFIQLETFFTGKEEE